MTAQWFRVYGKSQHTDDATDDEGFAVLHQCLYSYTGEWVSSMVPTGSSAQGEAIWLLPNAL